MSLSAKARKAEKHFKKARKTASEDSGFGDDLPQGRYLTKLISMEVGESQSSDRLQCAMGFKVLQGEYEGEKIFRYPGLDDADAIDWFAKDLRRLGHELPDSMGELNDLCDTIVKAGLIVKLSLKPSKNNPDFMNKYINKVVDSRGADDNGEDDGDGFEPGADEGGEPHEYAKGGKVTCPDDGDGVVYTITELDGEDVTVENDEGETWELTLADIEAVEDDGAPEDPGLEVGSIVQKEFDGEMFKGEVKEIDGDTVTVLWEDEDTTDESADDLEEVADGGTPEDPDSEQELTKGMEVEVRIGRKTVEATITFVSRDGGTINVKDADGELHKGIDVEKVTAVIKDD